MSKPANFTDAHWGEIAHRQKSATIREAIDQASATAQKQEGGN